MAEWKVRESDPTCYGCHRAFAGDERFRSALLFQPPDIERRDFCTACWDSMAAAETIAYWTLRAPEPEGVAPDAGPLDLNRIKRLIKVDLLAGEAPEGLAGLLCLMLARRRIARILAVRRDWLQVRFRDEDDGFDVPAPRLDGEALERAQAALWDILDQVAGNDHAAKDTPA